MRKLLLLLIVFVPMYLLSQEKINFINNEGNVIEFEISNNWYFIKYDSNQTNVLSTVHDFISISNNEALISVDNLNDAFDNNIEYIRSKIFTEEVTIKPVLIYKD